jgi:hypothetical protein
MVCNPYVPSVAAVARPIPGSAVTGSGPSQTSVAAWLRGICVVRPGSDTAAAMAASMRLPVRPALLSDRGAPKFPDRDPIESLQQGNEEEVAPPSKYSPEFREEAVQVALKSSKTIFEVARELDLNSETLRGWVKKHQRQRNRPGTPI